MHTSFLDKIRTNRHDYSGAHYILVYENNLSPTFLVIASNLDFRRKEIIWRSSLKEIEMWVRDDLLVQPRCLLGHGSWPLTRAATVQPSILPPAKQSTAARVRLQESKKPWARPHRWLPSSSAGTPPSPLCQFSLLLSDLFFTSFDMMQCRHPPHVRRNSSWWRGHGSDGSRDGR